MSFLSLTIPGPARVTLTSQGWIFQHWMQRVSYAHPRSWRRPTLVAFCHLPLLLLMVGSDRLLRADATDPQRTTPRSSQSVYQEGVHGSSTEGPGTASEALQETPDRQEFEKEDLDRSFDLQTKIQSAEESGADFGKVVEVSPQGGTNERQLDLQSLDSFDSGFTPLPNGSGWKIVVGPHLTIKDCRQELDQKIVAATNQYIAEELGREEVGRLLQIDADFVRSHLLYNVTEPEFVDTSYGEMCRLTAVLRFEHDRAFLDELDSRWKNVQREARLLQVGLGSSSILLLLATAFGYLKLDTMTLGYHSGRLQLCVVGIILALCAAGVGISRWILWI